MNKERICQQIVYLVSRSKPCPRFICSPIVVFSLRHFHVLTKLKDVFLLQLFDGRSNTQLRIANRVTIILILNLRFLVSSACTYRAPQYTYEHLTYKSEGAWLIVFFYKRSLKRKTTVEAKIWDKNSIEIVIIVIVGIQNIFWHVSSEMRNMMFQIQQTQSWYYFCISKWNIKPLS